ncbi:D-glycero-beta-D-manno-heptose-7-phosphate kinase [Niabella hibiscisoli]|uniref:D-glycero-beta-D-manno-heptose-7-phosphate kinase n=1 Tax=Niabella hibiscisoli TaxID=1825928 RepID=UPI001F0F9413|nr:D-glycero-beta-D-manno-heptose-7-phosphate kinase [Niabella hibiscisoli]MCH5720459.1 D-glycero-beta-D-manno-heptose-7-phosphate kinase [Niabella hibiscisoli]
MINKEEVSLLRRTKNQPHILVIGDIMADRYIWGSASRISPEAPVPVVNVKSETVTLGGAANVAQNLYKLNAKVSICGVTGSDPVAATVLSQLKKEKIDATGVVADKSRPTTLKTRVMAGNHQLLRVDRETTADIDANIETRLLDKLQAKLLHTDLVLLSDYNKGLLTHSFTQKLLQLCQAAGKKVMVDPKGLHYEKYAGAWLIKPNKRELAEATVTEKIETNEQLIKAARKLISKTKSQYLVVTRSEEGLSLISKKSDHNFPVKAREVFDVTGAGDTVFASLGYFVACGLDLATACELANYAAAIAVSKVGSVAVTIDEILSLINEHE